MMGRLRPLTSKPVMRASITPLASIFGSGFLIIVPVLERTLGALAVFGAIGVTVLAWLVGTAIRHNVAVVEPLAERRRLSEFDRRLEELSDIVIVAAYVISVALYLRIMAQYLGSFAVPEAESAERVLATLAVVMIVVVGSFRGFAGLDLMERIALSVVLLSTTVLGGALFFHDVGGLGDGLELPPVPDSAIGETLLVLGGIVITVQGFETIRYLGDEYDAETRIWASRLAQLVAGSIYIGFVAVATPVMGLGTDAGIDETLIDITERVVPALSLLVVITAFLSQFSAATADTAAAEGNFHRLFGERLRGPRAYTLTGAAAIAMVWLIPLFSLIAIASRAFAAYYAIQCLVALRTTENPSGKVGYGLLGLVLLAITLLAKPAG